MTERVGQDPFSTPAMLRQLPPATWPGLTLRRPWRRRCSPDCAGSPPLLIQVGTADLLLSDSKRLAAAAAEAGVDVTLEIGEGLPHVYPIMLRTPEAAEATGQTRKFLRARVR
jgi:monoterpene epsilon-lactone hydrolase